jgi:hypothetical protein
MAEAAAPDVPRVEMSLRDLSAVNVAGASVDQMSIEVAAVLALAVTTLMVRRAPRLGLAVWLAVVCFVPVWMGATVKVYLPPATAIGFLVVASHRPNVRTLVLADVAVVSLLAACVLPFVVGASVLSAAFVAFAHWGLGFSLGRLLPGSVDLEWTYRCLALILTVVSALALLEFTLAWNPFVHLHASNSLFSSWSPLQERGGVLRAEGAFGHSIALSSSIALAIPVTLASTFSLRSRVLMTTCMLAAAVVTFSRTGMLCAALALAMSVMFLRDGLSARLRILIVAALGIVAAAVLPLVQGTFAAAGAEASGSAEYRAHLTSLIPDMSLFGQASNAHHTPSGELYFGNFRSIDSAVILLGLTYGALALAFAIGLLVTAVAAVVRGRATPPTIAVVAQIPSLATVALITQYAILFWFFVGLAICSQSKVATRQVRQNDTSGSHPSQQAVSSELDSLV